MKSLNINDLKNMRIDYSNVVNHTLDVSSNSILSIDNGNKDKLNNYINLSLEKKPQLVITSNNCEINNEKVLRFENYEIVFNYILKKICKQYKDLNYFGITGTNGKTTSAYYLNQLIGEKNLFIGTIDDEKKYSFTKEKVLTTPKLFNIVKLISLQKKNIDSVSLEVSSHALDQERLGNLNFLISGFTNLSQDHLDYHGSMQDYLKVKAKLFRDGISRKFVYVDSEVSKKLVDISNIPSFSIGDQDHNNVKYINSDSNKIIFQIDGNEVECELNLLGPKVIENFLLAFSMAYYSGLYNLKYLINKSKEIKNPPGRYEKISKNGKTAVVDYAHTPAAIREVIKYSKTKYRNVKVILGAGGERDKSKRMKMGEASSSADYITITNDNPRSEDPLEISKNILEGIPLNKNSDVVLDRKKAIFKGIESLKEDEVLLILGKGHEKVQEIENKLIPFDDTKIAIEAMELEN